MFRPKKGCSTMKPCTLLLRTIIQYSLGKIQELCVNNENAHMDHGIVTDFASVNN